MAIHRALKKAPSPRASPAKRTKRAAAAVQSAKRTTRSPSSRKSTSPPSSSPSPSPSPSPKRRRSTGSSSSERGTRKTNRDQRNVIVVCSPAIASYTDAGVRCSYCRVAFRTDNRNGGLGLSNFRRHLVDQHPKGTFVEGPMGELEVLGLRHAHPFAGETSCKLANADDYEREGLGTAALAAQDEADKKDAAETLIAFSEKLVLFSGSEIPPRFRVASHEQL
ncbi:uncharacterized protein SCHCODRAFT_02703470 [Schizophyllum commune H4-8]|uniref:Uncharacterized protein n=1 Tax=Schizophyllum commune (strain H4-8 / FGSC 9210) TaxID=578458 RepID=D8QB29_SCHCM|nr:uncharacterized protein SCHCODRAFT_02703470 [Schizophyllum commune H4-8]KAI5889012.1 hypothetical protein SCHCODRAFT_02703470 [Schizophyllum commune H4-8]